VYPFERFSERATNVLVLAQEEAERSTQSYIGTEHILLALLRVADGIGAKALGDLGIEIDAVREAIKAVVGANERIVIQQIIPTSRVKTVIEISATEARRMGSPTIGTHHVLLGLIIEGEGIAAHVLSDLGADAPKVQAAVERLAATENEEPGTKRSLPATFSVGNRVLVHDPDPPHLLWEGRINKVEEAEVYELIVAHHPGGEMVKADLRLIHPIPMIWTRECPLCKAT
jgi:ATP-dependent Clp protease ATP-binding subunit ClpA